ncbi:MAG: hypothetical protein ACOC35_11800 [Promethearchaeia archaeon]
MLKRKLVFFGPPETGKTTIKKVIFEGMDPAVLLEDPLKPTRGLKPSIHSWLDLEVGVFDSPGQEIETLLENEKVQLKTFGNANVVIYLLDFKKWKEEKKVILQQLKNIQQILDKKAKSAESVIFFHKIDLIPADSRESQVAAIRKNISEELLTPNYFTSIYPNLIYSLYSAFYDVLGNLSEDTANIKEILKGKIAETSQTMIFLTNENDNIVVQAMNQDFEFNLINYIHEMIGQLNETINQMKANDKIEHFTLQTANEFNIILKNISHSKHNLKNLICISGDLNANKLIFMVGKLSREIYNYYYKNKK